MHYLAVDAKFAKRVAGRVPAEPRLVHGVVRAAVVVLPQMVKERLGAGGLTELLHKARLGEHRHRPLAQMDINSHENVLSFEIFFVTLHSVTHKRDWDLFVILVNFAPAKVQIISLSRFFFAPFVANALQT